MSSEQIKSAGLSEGGLEVIKPPVPDGGHKGRAVGDDAGFPDGSRPADSQRQEVHGRKFATDV